MLHGRDNCRGVSETGEYKIMKGAITIYAREHLQRKKTCLRFCHKTSLLTFFQAQAHSSLLLRIPHSYLGAASSRASSHTCSQHIWTLGTTGCSGWHSSTGSTI